MNVKRYVNLGFVIAGLLLWVVLTPFYAWLFGWIAPLWDAPVLGAEFRMSNLLGLVTAVGAVAYLFVREDIYEKALKIGQELARVTWPKWPETRKSSIVVIITTILIALILAGFDFVWAEVTSLIYSIG